MWLPKGTILKQNLESFLRKLQKKEGYQEVITPHIGIKNLYETSGHYEKYGSDSFRPIETPGTGETFLLKPMNCPHHCEIFNNRKWSYKDLPVRYSEFGTVYRYEQSGELQGLKRVRGFTVDDAHIFCRPDQLLTEFNRVIDLVLHVFKNLSFDKFEIQVSFRDLENKSKYIGSEKNWNLAEEAIIKSVESKKLNYKIEYGEAAFYGPKLDFMIKDSLNRNWQLRNIKFDYNLQTGQLSTRILTPIEKTTKPEISLSETLTKISLIVNPIKESFFMNNRLDDDYIWNIPGKDKILNHVSDELPLVEYE